MIDKYLKSPHFISDPCLISPGNMVTCPSGFTRTGRSGTCQCLCTSTYTGVVVEIALPSDGNNCDVYRSIESEMVRCGSSSRCNYDITKPNCLETDTGATPTYGSYSVSCQVDGFPFISNKKVVFFFKLYNQYF